MELMRILIQFQIHVPFTETGNLITMVDEVFFSHCRWSLMAHLNGGAEIN
jgi:hypothetical protein